MNIKIKQLHAQNFKGFSNLIIDFSSSAVILGGMNGYGKTTIFDALELLLTGRIKRLIQYSENLINKRYSRSQAHIPLVFDMTQPIVSIDGRFILGEDEIVLKREAKVSEMSNPIDFKPFENLLIFDEKSKGYSIVTEQEKRKYGIGDLEKDFDFLNYLSQEESTSFLKCKDEDRTKIIQNLLDTNLFDNPMNKIEGINKIIDKTKKQLSEKKDMLDKEIRQLKSNVSNMGNVAEYISLSNNHAVWDQDNPKFSHEEFNSWITEGGIIDNLTYYLENESAFKQNQRNKILNQLLTEGVLSDVVFYQKNKVNEAFFSTYSILNKSLFVPVSNLTSSALQTLKIDSQFFPSDVISDEIIQIAREMINSYLLALSSASNIQKIVQELLEYRTTFAHKIDEANGAIAQTKCPLCGSEFNSTKALNDSIIGYETELKSNFASLNKGLGENFAQLKTFLIDKLVNPLKSFYATQSITEQISNRFQILDKDKIEKDIQNLVQLGVEYDISQTESDCISKIEHQLKSMYIPVDNYIDIKLLEKTYNSYIKDIDPDKLTIQNLKQKKAYLIYHWNKTQSGLLSEKQHEFDVLVQKIQKLDEKKKKLKDLNGKIKQKKNQYVTKIISDIQVLFYVYSGRILQDSYFGRGLFLKPDLERKRILFVSNNYKENDVDALYNMSSGQLVAVAIAFMLSLNKLYSSNKIIAIDDPVQTIDDINLWGLMETIRHDFKDNFILISTHEKNYGELLDYKFRKIGMESSYIDMAKFHQNNNNN